MFGQRLASNDKDTRDKAVKTLARYLKSGPTLEEIDLAKIWKALFYCMWHADKPKVQNELAERLGSLVHAVPGSKATLFAKTFFAMMMREWPNIDRLRLNKYYTLLKCMLKNSLRQLQLAGWPAGGVESFAEILRLGPFCSRSPPGLRYWLVDNLVPTLVAELKPETRSEVVMALLEPLFLALGAAVDPHSLRRTTEAVDALLEALSPEAEAEAMEDEVEEAEAEAEEGAPRLQAELPLPLLAERLFALASAKRTRETNRKHLYSLQQRVEALAAASGAAPAIAAPAAEMTPAPRADPEQVQMLRRLIGSKAGGKAVPELEPTPEVAASASRPKTKKRHAEPEAAPTKPKKLARKMAEAAEAAEAAEEPLPAAKVVKACARTGKTGKPTKPKKL